ncbi:tyrosine aminotransferase [soil metagenome]
MHFTTLLAQQADPILSMVKAFASDTRSRKIDLGLGVYRDSEGATPVMTAVKAAETRVLAEQTSKTYLGIDGDPVFVEALSAFLFGGGALDGHRSICGLQTVGGTGAVRLAADLVVGEKPDRTVWIGTPTWPNHIPIFSAAGARIRYFQHYDPATQALDTASILTTLEAADRGDVVLLHGCCHNPSGADFPAALWQQVADIIARRGLLPIVDIAYHGLGRGLDEDLSGLRILIDTVPAALIAYSCSKNFALYRDRLGALFVVGEAKAADLAWQSLIQIARASYSMPPDHGAAVVRTILTDPTLTRGWQQELNGMRDRVRGLRAALAAHGRVGRFDLGPLAQQNGFFSLLPLSPAEVATLRADHGIYLVPNGRMNIAGLLEEQIGMFIKGLAALP